MLLDRPWCPAASTMVLNGRVVVAELYLRWNDRFRPHKSRLRRQLLRVERKAVPKVVGFAVFDREVQSSPKLVLKYLRTVRATPGSLTLILKRKRRHNMQKKGMVQSIIHRAILQSSVNNKAVLPLQRPLDCNRRIGSIARSIEILQAILLSPYIKV